MVQYLYLLRKFSTGWFFAKIVHTNYTRVHWYKGTGVLVPVYWLREQPYVRIRTKLYLPTSWCAMARTASTSRLLTFVPVPCIPVVLRTVSHWFACVHVIRGFCHYRRTWCCRESGMLRPTRSWTSRAEAVAAKDKCLKHWIFWNLVLRKGLLELAAHSGCRHSEARRSKRQPTRAVRAFCGQSDRSRLRRGTVHKRRRHGSTQPSLP